MQQEEAFLAALLQDIGMLVLDQVLGEEYGEIHAKAHDARRAGARREAGAGDDARRSRRDPRRAVEAAAAAQRRRSRTITTRQTRSNDRRCRKLAELVAAQRALRGRVRRRRAGRRDRRGPRTLAARSYKMADADTDALLDDIGKRTKEVASLFEINIGSAVEYEAILKKANEALVEITLQSQMQATTLQQQNQELKIAATTDALTGLANRKRFDDFLAEQFAVAQKGGKPLSLLMIDIDKFKSVNDKYGHPAGDAVIRTIGQALKTAREKQDLAARYGGEEMALVLPGHQSRRRQRHRRDHPPCDRRQAGAA